MYDCGEQINCMFKSCNIFKYHTIEHFSENWNGLAIVFQIYKHVLLIEKGSIEMNNLKDFLCFD